MSQEVRDVCSSEASVDLVGLEVNTYLSHILLYDQ